jgi:hypothetical protein
MATNETYRVGNNISLPVPSGKKSGDPVRVGGLNGVCQTDRARTAGITPTNPDGTLNATYDTGGGNPDGNASVWLDGAHTFQVAFAANVGDQIYILADGSALTGTATGNNPYGKALSTKGATAGPLVVLITN